MTRVAAPALAIAVALASGASAHHGAAEYHVDREIAVTGSVREWRWTNPHTWVYLTVSTPDGRVEEWEGEGPPLTWAAQRGWSNDFLKPGETVTLQMYPSRRDGKAGLVKRITRRNGDVIPVDRPWLPRER